MPPSRMKMSRLSALVAAVLMMGQTAPAAPVSQGDPDLGPILAKVRRHAAVEGERLWPGYGAAPFEFLLVLADKEVLLCRTAPVINATFTPDGADPQTGCNRQVRPRSQLSDRMLAAMPIFAPPPTIVMGTPRTTGLSEGAWVRTIYHEHFHQFQYSRSGYFDRLKALDLAGGDDSGMWVLNYAFPYGDPAVGKAHQAASLALAEAVAARGRPDFLPQFDRYLAAREAFRRSVSMRDWRYLEFQLWQEGVARWTEIAVAASDPDPAVRAAAATMEAAAITALGRQDLQVRGREIVYAHGAGEAMLLEACGPAWRRAYLQTMAMGPLLTAARARCASAS